MINPKENSKRIETDILERYQSKKAGILLKTDLKRKNFTRKEDGPFVTIRLK